MYDKTFWVVRIPSYLLVFNMRVFFKQKSCLYDNLCLSFYIISKYSRLTLLSIITFFFYDRLCDYITIQLLQNSRKQCLSLNKKILWQECKLFLKLFSFVLQLILQKQITFIDLNFLIMGNKSGNLILWRSVQSIFLFCIRTKKRTVTQFL